MPLHGIPEEPGERLCRKEYPETIVRPAAQGRLARRWSVRSSPPVRPGHGITETLIKAVCAKLPDVPVIVTVAPVSSFAVGLAVSVKVLVLLVILGLNDAVTPLGRPEAVNVTLPVKLPVSFTEIVVMSLPPWATANVLGDADSVKPLRMIWNTAPQP